MLLRTSIYLLVLVIAQAHLDTILYVRHGSPNLPRFSEANKNAVIRTIRSPQDRPIWGSTGLVLPSQRQENSETTNKPSSTVPTTVKNKPEGASTTVDTINPQSARTINTNVNGKIQPDNNELPRKVTCDVDKYEVFYNGKCERLLQQGPCEQDHWMIQTETTTKCAVRPCPKNFILLDSSNSCASINDGPHDNEHLCSGNKRPTVTLYGTIVCLCHETLIDFEGNCYPPYTQGPCKDNNYIAINSIGKPVCQPNPCNKGLIPLKTTTSIATVDSTHIVQTIEKTACYKLNEKGPCPEHQFLQVNSETLKLECEGLALKSLFRIRGFKCSSGYKRLKNGECKKGVPVFGFPGAYDIFRG